MDMVSARLERAGGLTSPPWVLPAWATSESLEGLGRGGLSLTPLALPPPIISEGSKDGRAMGAPIPGGPPVKESGGAAFRGGGKGCCSSGGGTKDGCCSMPRAAWRSISSFCCLARAASFS